MKDKESISKLYLSLEQELNNDIASLEVYNTLTNHREKKEKILERILTKKNTKIFDEYITIESEIEVLEMQEAFIKGFSSAYKLLIDSLK